MPPKRKREAQAATSSRKKAKGKLGSDASGSDERISHAKAEMKARGRAKEVKRESESELGDPMEGLMEDPASLPLGMESSDSDSSEEDWENCLQDTIDPGASDVKHEALLRDLEITLEPNKAQLWS